jgi:hypothetical protein
VSTKEGIEILLKELVAKARAAEALIESHDGSREARFAIGETPNDYIATGGYYRNGERLKSAIRDFEVVLERVEELRKEGYE